ncbi:MAG: HEAT repeat domain-containing protein [Myxococcota bacterium]|jgi:HEAT repeat protein|nr:HEAT repeat domain-containing protein [Myxococcota bacterium]
MRSWLALLSLWIVTLVPAFAQAQAWSRHVPSLRAAEQLQSGDALERRAAARALGVRGDAPGARAALVEALRTERDGSVRAEIARALGRRAHPALADTLARGLAESSALDAEPFARALVAVGTGTALEHLVEALGRDEHRAAATVALQEAGLAAAPALSARLRETPTFVPAIQLLGSLRDVEAVPLLTRIALGEHAPPVRLAAVVALRTIGDARSAPALRATLDGLSDALVVAELRDATLEALSFVGDARDAPRVVARLEGAEGAERRRWLAVLLRLDPETAERELRAAVTSDDPQRVRDASDVVLASPQPALLAIVHGLLREGARADEAATALAELGPSGVAILVHEAERPEVRRELAVALRTDRAGGHEDEALAILRRHTDATGLAWRAVARDRNVRDTLEASLASSSSVSSERALAAQSLGVLGGAPAIARLREALEHEREADVWVAIAFALARLGASVDPDLWIAALDDPRRALAATLLAAEHRGDARAARRRDRALRRALHAEDPRLRANAAWALGRVGDRAAIRVLEDLEHDVDADVRRASRHALATLDPSRGAAVASVGSEAARFRIASARAEPMPLDVALADGRTLRVWTAPTGEVVVVDLPSQVVDVRVRAED